MTVQDAKRAGMSYEVWLRWRACERKQAYTEKPIQTTGLVAYECAYCGLWHLASTKGDKR